MIKGTDSLSFEFDNNSENLPLAARLRPTHLNDYIGQSHLLAVGQPLRSAIEQGHCHSLIFWGPPGTGKTTLAEIIAKHTNAVVERLSAVTSGIKDIRAAIESAKQRMISHGKKTILFVDEVHRFNKSQQDAFLPFIEDGTITFIGATTENPAFELNNAILSRTRVYVLKKLSDDEIKQVLDRAITNTESGLGHLKIAIGDDAEQNFIAQANGDARRLLNLLENCVSALQAETKDSTAKTFEITAEHVNAVAGSRNMLYDKGGDAFYDIISAFHKSVRGSAPDAALYWYCRILEAGGDALYVARRLLAIASEDIGNADPKALTIAINAWDTFVRVGPAEGERAIAQAAIYLALAPKSNAVYTAFKAAKRLARETGHLDVPLHLKNATSNLTKELGHGEQYRYAHDELGAYAAGEQYFPELLKHTTFYQPSERGLEIKLKDKLNYLAELDKKSTRKRYE